MRRALLRSSCSLAACPADDRTSMDAGNDVPRIARDAPDAREPVDVGPVGERIREAETGAGRRGCTFGRGAMPAEAMGLESPLGEDIRIRRLTLVMQERRSLDPPVGSSRAARGPDASRFASPITARSSGSSRPGTTCPRSPAVTRTRGRCATGSTRAARARRGHGGRGTQRRVLRGNPSGGLRRRARFAMPSA
jgi:hypothetical protein